MQRWHDVSVFALLPDGTYRYDAAAHRMLLITMDDLRHLARGVDANRGPAIELVYVVDCDGMQRARDEIRDYTLYDYIIVNRDFDRALAELRSIVTAERCRTRLVRSSWIDDLLR